MIQQSKFQEVSRVNCGGKSKIQNPKSKMIFALFAAMVLSAPLRAADGWLTWRGPNQDGTIDEKNLPEKWNLLWSAPVPGQSTPCVFKGRVYIMGYKGEGADLQEGVFCVDAEKGTLIWERLFNDFMSDIIYMRYSTGAPCVDAETGNVYMQGTQGLMMCFDSNGKTLWSHSMMEEFGRLTFPNGRTTGPVIDGNLVITSGITANWGAHGAGGHRFYAFNKKTGELVWASQPGEKPRDSSFAIPIFGWIGKQRVFYSGNGDGSICCVNARTGQPIWRYVVALGGINPNVLLQGDTVVAVHGSENIDSASIGRMVAIRAGDVHPTPEGPALLTKTNELWRNDISQFHSSPTRNGKHIFVMDDTAHLICVDSTDGKQLWMQHIGTEERNSSPICADGKLYIPVLDGNFYIVKATEKAYEQLHVEKLEGKCFGSPAAWDGRVYVQTTEKLYCIGKPDGRWRNEAAPADVVEPVPGPAAKMLVVPAEFLAKPGETVPLSLIQVDKDGNWLPKSADVSAAKAKWEKYIPPTAKVKSMVNGSFTPDGAFVADATKAPSAGALKADIGGIVGVNRGRVLTDLPISENFDEIKLAFAHSVDAATGLPADVPGTDFNFPPLPWIGARFKWEIHAKDGNNCLVKTVENKFFQRALTFIGSSDMKNYTTQADVMSDGVVRKVGGKEKIVKMSEVGLINQRYIIVLKGGNQTLEVTSNSERLQVDAPFAWTPGVWYTLKARVDIAADGSGVVRGKAWKKGEAEPEKWTIEVPHKTAHQNGSPGIFGFSPNDMPCYVDNLVVTPN